MDNIKMNLINSVSEDVKLIALAPVMDLCVNDEETSGPITATITFK